MKNSLKNNKSGFTLIEILVSIAIFSIMMVSVISIFISSTDVSLKSDINRMMQENIKNVIETIADDVRNKGILGVSENPADISCDFIVNHGLKYKRGTKLCVGSGSFVDSYYLAKYGVSGTTIRVSDISADCSSIKDHCFVVKNGVPLSNSSVSFKDLKFYVSSEDVPKVTMTFIVQPAVRKGVRSSLIQENKIVFQTSISERLIKND